MMKSNSSNERRHGERRQGNGVLPAGMAERRVNLERRMFNLDAICIEDWLRKARPGAGKPN